MLDVAATYLSAATSARCRGGDVHETQRDLALVRAAGLGDRADWRWREIFRGERLDFPAMAAPEPALKLVMAFGAKHALRTSSSSGSGDDDFGPCCW